MENRLKLIRKELKLTQETLGKKLGITKNALSMIETGKQVLSERNKNILVQDLNVNPDWIETGKGKMFNAPPDMKLSAGQMPFQSIPLYSIEKTAGLVPLFRDGSNFEPIDHIYIPNMPKCDGAIYVAGEGMYPMLKSGDIVLYRQLRNMNDILWGEMYLLSFNVDGEEYITIKYVRKSERQGYLKLVGYETHHAEKEIEISKINAIAFIKASIRINSIR